MEKYHSIFLIIDSDGPAYQSYARCRANWRRYMNVNSEIKCYFIRSNPGQITEVMVNEETNTISFKREESYIPGILDNTLDAIKYCSQRFDYRFIVRTNLSSFWNFTTYKKYVETLSENSASGALGNCEVSSFISGSGFIMTKDVIQKVIENINLFDKSIIDDVSFGIFFNKMKINMVSGSRIDYVNLMNPQDIFTKIENDLPIHYHYRVLADRGQQDEFVKNTLINRVYNL